MTPEARHLLKSVLSGCLVALIGAAFLAWPSYREGRQLRRDIASLEHRTAISPATADEERALRAKVLERRDRIARETREIPESPEVAQIFSRLSLPRDGIHVIDQSFTTGTPVSAGSDASWPERAIPLSIDHRGSFDSGFSLVRAVERMDRLLRINSLHISADRSDESRPVPIVRMQLGIEAIYASAPVDREVAP